MSILQKSISIPDMFKLTNSKTNNTWGLQSYLVPRKYQDPIRIKQQRQLTSKSQSKAVRYVTKKGHYLNQIQKNAKWVPGPGAYNVLPVEKKPKGKVAVLRRGIFIDEIFRRAERQKSPSPCQYELQQSQAKRKQRLAKYQKRPENIPDKGSFIEDSRALSLQIPGPGNYNPHLLKMKTFGNTKNYKDFLKYQSQNTKRLQELKKSKRTTDQFYNPFPVEYQLFGKSLVSPSKLNSQRNNFGTQRRFKQHSKKKQKWPKPGPDYYKINNWWHGKEQAIKKQKSQPWFKKISQPFVKSIYND